MEDVLLYKLVSANKEIASSLLKEYGEIYPLACTIMTVDDLPRQLILWQGDEHPDSAKLVSEFERALRKGVNENNYLGGSICYPVYLPDGEDALEFKVIIKGFQDAIITWPYQIGKTEIEFGTPLELNP